MLKLEVRFTRAELADCSHQQTEDRKRGSGYRWSKELQSYLG